jgi:hypothetical protein
MCLFLQNCKSCLHYPVYYTGTGWVNVYFELNFALIELFVKHFSTRAATHKLNFPRDWVVQEIANWLEWSHSWEANRFSTSQEIPHILWKYGLLPFLQEHTTYPCPEPDQSSSCYPSQLISWRSTVILYFNLCLILAGRLLVYGFPTKPFLYLSSPLYVPHAQPISFFLIWSPE